MINEEIILLLYKRLSDQKLTKDERTELATWIRRSGYNRSVYKEMIIDVFPAPDLKNFTSYDKEGCWEKLMQEIQPSQPPKQQYSFVQPAVFKLRSWLKYAAILLIVGASAAYFLYSRSNTKNIANNDRKGLPVKTDAEPGTYKAILTLKDGTTIDLENSPDGKLFMGEEVVITKQNRQLLYEPRKAAEEEFAGSFYNKVSTPPGGQWTIVLPDKSKVLLNSATSIRFPTVFARNERKVEMNGEIYFDVRKDAARPFRVTAKRIRVEVLGTRFNVKAYDDEATIQTTLLEGTVKVEAMDGKPQASVLKPGQQAELTHQNKLMTFSVDTLHQAGWKDEVFKFYQDSIETVMRQICRWYDMQVDYKVRPGQLFFGTVARNSLLSEVMDMLKTNAGVRYRIEGKKIILY